MARLTQIPVENESGVPHVNHSLIVIDLGLLARSTATQIP